MPINMVVRRRGDYRDPQLELLRKQGVPLLKNTARSRTGLAIIIPAFTRGRFLSPSLIQIWQPMNELGKACRGMRIGRGS